MCSKSCQALLLSSSNCYGYTMLGFAKNEICAILKLKKVVEIIFFPYAQCDYYGYTKKIKDVIEPWGFRVSGAHTYDDLNSMLVYSRAVFLGGGNTFLLLKTLYDLKIMELLKERVANGSIIYIGSSAGTNVATKSIHTANDMPIIYPPSFDGLGLVPFNINPHYIEEKRNEIHKRETRDERISEYLQLKNSRPVLGLKEGSILRVDGTNLCIKGVDGAVLFRKNVLKKFYSVGSNVSFLLQEDYDKVVK